jgi:hypothetical protein
MTGEDCRLAGVNCVGHCRLEWSSSVAGALAALAALAVPYASNTQPKQP